MRKLRKGERYGLYYRLKPTQKKTLKCLQPIAYGLLLIYFMLFNLSNAWAQSPDSQEAAEGQEEVIPLRVGDKVPADFWTKEHLFAIDGDTIRRSLSEYRGKLLILDFWATWCGACKAWFPKNIQLQRKYGDDLQILLVNSDTVRDDLQKIEKVLTTERFFEGDTGSSIIYDSYLKRLFPHLAIPHYVWIDHSERVRAITTFEFVSSTQISRILGRKERSKQ